MLEGSGPWVQGIPPTLMIQRYNELNFHYHEIYLYGVSRGQNKLIKINCEYIRNILDFSKTPDFKNLKELSEAQQRNKD